MNPTEGCPGCGVELPGVDGPSHPYMLGSAACWKGYGELLAVQYGEPERMRFQQVVVDAFAGQHPGDGSPPAVRSVAIHLMTLALFLEQGVDPAHGHRLHRLMVERPVFHLLERPEPPPGPALTFRHVPLDGPPELARERALEWGASVWEAWGDQRGVVRGWLSTSGLLPSA
jgi:hypothetical protein